MGWIFIGFLLGSTVTSPHDTREACEGRATILREKGVIGTCVAPTYSAALGTVTLTPNQQWLCSNGINTVPCGGK